MFALCLLSLALAPHDPQPVLLATLNEYTRYADSIWHLTDDGTMGWFGDGASGGNGGIRGTCGTMLAYATLIRAGQPEADARLRQVTLGLRYASSTHLTGAARCVDGKQWGHGWQTNLWAGSLGFACALLEDRLPADLVAACRRVVADEADYRAGIPPASGYRGDSKAEENAWNSNIVALAAAWLPGDPRAPVWLKSAKQYLVNTYTVADTTGDPLAAWVTTQTCLPSYTVENHGFFHPEYQMVAGMSMGDSLVMARLLNPEVARELEPFATHLVRPVWAALSRVLLDSGDLAFPSGLDWALHSYGQISYYAFLSTWLDDPLARWAEERVAALTAARQQVNGDGRYTGESVPDGFYREAVNARRVALAWWHHQGAPAPTTGVTPPPAFVANLPDVGLLLHRGPHGFVSVSYGLRTMAMVVPPARDGAPHLVTPRQPSLLPGRVTAAQVEASDVADDGFMVQLLMQQGPMVATRARIVSRGGAVALIEQPLDSLGLTTTNEAFPIGIENHALTGGTRTIAWAGGEQSIVERSGQAARPTGGWVSIDDRLSAVAGPSGGWEYRAPDRYNRNGAAEDTLSWRPADPRAARYAIVLDGGAAVARAVATTVVWQSSEREATLQFRAPDGQTVSLALPLEQATPSRPVLTIAGVEVTTESDLHPAKLAIDGDPATFWVSNHNGAEPGHGPTPERPERLTIQLRQQATIGGLILVPRPSYGPRKVRLLVGGRVVAEAELRHEPQLIDLPAVAADAVTIELLSAYDPRFPETPRNVQIGEVIVLGPTAN